MKRASTDSRHPAVITVIAASTTSQGPRTAAALPRAMPVALCSGRADEQSAQLVGLAQHRVVAGVQLGPRGLEALGGAPLVRLRGIARALAPDHRGRPRLIPERRRIHGRLQRRYRM